MTMSDGDGDQCCIQKMWPWGHTENFQNVGGGGEGVYDVLTFQKSRGGKSSHTYAPYTDRVAYRGAGTLGFPPPPQN